MKKAIILIHGFCENCDISFSKFLAYSSFARYDVIKYTITGHDPEIDEEFDYKKEIKKINQFAKKVVDEYDQVDVIGFSLGGALAGYVASNYNINKLIVVSPAYKYLTSVDITHNFAVALKNVAHSKSVKTGVQDYIDNNVTHDESVFIDLKDFDKKQFPAMVNFMKIVEILKEGTSSITCPTLIIQGENDELVPISSSLYVLSKVTNKNKMMVIAPDALHRVLSCDNATMYYDMIEDFIKKGKFKIDLDK